MAPVVLPVVTVSQPRLAQFGTPTDFVITIANTDALAAGQTITGFNVSVTSQSGRPSPSATVAVPTFAVGDSTQVAAAGTMYVTFQACFYGSALGGIPSAAPNDYVLTVTANMMQTDSPTTLGIVASPPLPVSLNSPIWGQPGAPPVPSVTISSLQFINTANSGLHLLGWA